MTCLQQGVEQHLVAPRAFGIVLTKKGFDPSKAKGAAWIVLHCSWWLCCRGHQLGPLSCTGILNSRTALAGSLKCPSQVPHCSMMNSGSCQASYIIHRGPEAASKCTCSLGLLASAAGFLLGVAASIPCHSAAVVPFLCWFPSSRMLRCHMPRAIGLHSPSWCNPRQYVMRRSHTG